MDTGQPGQVPAGVAASIFWAKGSGGAGAGQPAGMPLPGHREDGGASLRKV